MEPYAGFEPQVGEVRALRTFRIGPGGSLLPLFDNEPWVSGTNTARCRRRQPGDAEVERHEVLDPECSCGFYAYGGEAVVEYPHARHVLAVVACWGRVIAGTRGVRAEHCRVEALWLSEAVPTDLVGELVERYPPVMIYRDRTEMLAEHPLTVLDCYDLQEPQQQSWTRRWIVGAVMIAVLVTALPASWWDEISDARLVWAGVLGFFLVGAFVPRRGRPTDLAVRRRRLVFQAVALWMVAPFAGPVGVLLLRIPLLQLGILLLVHRFQMARVGRQFPADLG
jgi:hypothetical protein